MNWFSRRKTLPDIESANVMLISKAASTLTGRHHFRSFGFIGTWAGAIDDGAGVAVSMGGEFDPKIRLNRSARFA